MSFTFEDAYHLMDRALLSTEGLRVTCKSKAAATTIRHRCYHARKQLQREAMVGKDPSDKTYGRTPYDTITILLRDRVLEFRIGGLDLSDLLDEAVDITTGETLDIKEI